MSFFLISSPPLCSTKMTLRVSVSFPSFYTNHSPSLSLSLLKPAVPKVSAVAVAAAPRDKRDKTRSQDEQAVEHSRRADPPAAAQQQPRGRQRQRGEGKAVGEEEGAASSTDNPVVVAALGVRVDVRPPHRRHQNHRDRRQDPRKVPHEREAARRGDRGVGLGSPAGGEERPGEGRAVGGDRRRERRRDFEIRRRRRERSEEAVEG